MSNTIDYVFWPAAVRMHSFRAHVVAAAAGGFTSLAIAPNTVRDARTSGLSFRDIRRIAEDAGTPLSTLDSLTDWAPIRTPSNIDHELRDRYQFTVDEALEMCEELGLGSILAVGGYDKDAVPLNALIDGFGRACDRAAAIGVRIDLEFMPFWGLPDLAAAWAIVGGAGRANSGITVDTWHFSKGNPDFNLLKSLPGNTFVTVQVSDGQLQQISGSLHEDTVRFRNFPGEGNLPVVDILKVLWAKGHLRSIGPEVFSDEANAMTPEIAGRKCATTLWNVLRAAGIPVPSSLPR
jgi:sugar phosphate isomerase/epimerase